MKKLIAVAILMTGLASFAQEGKPMQKRDKAEQLSPAQRNELHLKKLTLELGLNDAQQKEMAKVIADESAKRETVKAEREKKVAAGQKPTADERFAMKSKMLDEQIAVKERVKKILTPEQFAKWEKMKTAQRHQMKQGAKKHKMKPEDKK